MPLLIEYFSEAEEYVREKKEKLKELELQFRRVSDSDIKREINIISREIDKKLSEIKDTILLNLDEFRYLQKYYPNLFSVFVEDQYIGPTISSKLWLLEVRRLSPEEASIQLQQIKQWRDSLRDAKKMLKGWYGKVEYRSFVATYPILRGIINSDMEKEDVLEAISGLDKMFKKQGWALLISDSLIKIPLSRYVDLLKQAAYEERLALDKTKKTAVRGTVAEAISKKEYDKAFKKRLHYELMIRQILLSNPEYLRSIKKNKSWLSSNKKTVLSATASTITPKTVREKAWFDEMKKKVGSDGK